MPRKRTEEDENPPVFLTPAGPQTELEETVKQRYLQSLGFADLARSAPDTLFHGMAQNVPRDQLDTPVMGGVRQEDDWSPVHGPYTMRQIMELLKSMSPSRSIESP